MFKIDRKVPMPEITGRGAPPKYPFREMQVNDSFFIPKGNNRSLATRASIAGKALGYRFTVRAVEGGVRIWRVK